MRNLSLHDTLEAFAADAAGCLSEETASGAEIPFELTETEGRPGRVPLYCYRPLTGAFIRERLGLLSALPSYAPAAHALLALDGVDAYLRHRGERRIPDPPREQADAALRSFLAGVFAERSNFGFDRGRFELAYDELERVLYDGRCLTIVLTPLLGVSLDPDTSELALGDGLSLVRGETLQEAPTDAVWGGPGASGAGGEEPNVLLVLNAGRERAESSPVSLARGRFRRVLTALRLFERGGYSLGPLAWTRTDAGPWRSVALGGSGRPRLLTLIGAAQEDELRAFCNLVSRRTPTSGEVAWALGRYELGCERLAPFETLTDHLLALRALLEPEGPGSGRLAQRLSVLCAAPEGRVALAERTAHAISLERAVISGLAPAGPGANELVMELSEHLRALLRDVLCGHLDADLRAVADDLLARAAEPIPEQSSEEVLLAPEL